jgi:hypothetical protein
VPEHLAEAGQDYDCCYNFTPDHCHEGTFEASSASDQEDAYDDPDHHPREQACCQQPQPPLPDQDTLGHDADAHGQGICGEQESARDRGQVQEPFDKGRQGEQDSTDPGAEEACVDEQCPGRDRSYSPVWPVRYGPAQGHLQGICRHFEQQRYPGQRR